MEDGEFKFLLQYFRISPPLVDFRKWRVLIVTNETADAQLAEPAYEDFDCALVRTLSDPQSETGDHFGVRRRADGGYKATIVIAQPLSGFQGTVYEGIDKKSTPGLLRPESDR